MNHDEYIAACGRADKTPSGPDWNTRYRAALKLEGLGLTTTWPANAHEYKYGGPMMAPPPHPDDPHNGWVARETFIVLV